MDKKTLILFSLLLLPGFLFLATLFEPGFIYMYSNSTEWYSSYTFIITLIVLCIVLGAGSIIALIFGKNIPYDNIYNLRVEKRKKASTKFLLKFLETNGITSFTEEDVREFVDENYDEVVKDIN